MNLLKQKIDFFYVLVFLICCFKLTCNVYDYYDVCLVDEHSYLESGVKHKLVVEYGPLYSLWYYFLSFFTDGNIHLMFLNFKLLSIIYPLLTYWFLRKLQANPTFAFVLSFLILVGEFNVAIAPKVVIFMNLMQLIILAFAFKKENIESRNIIIAFLLFISYYIRPEYKLSFSIFFIYVVVGYLYKYYKGEKPKKIVSFFVLIILLILISFFVGFPFKNQSGKMLLAFGSSFALNYVKWHPTAENPWTNWLYIVHDVFGKISSPIDALLSNPSLFFKHIFFNVRDYIWIFTNFIIQTFIPLRFIRESVFSAVLFFLLFGGLFSFYFYYYQLQLKKDKVITKLKKYYFLLFVALLLLLPNIISVVLITTRWHYMALQFPVFVTLIAIVASIITVKKIKIENNFTLTAFFIFIVVIVFMLTPLPKNNKSLIASNRDRPNIVQINKLKELPLNNKKIKALNCDLIFFATKNADFTHYVDKQIGHNNVMKNIGFYEYLKVNNFNFICVNSEIADYRDYKNDKEWQDFLINFSSYTFVKIQPDSSCYYLIKKELLN